MNLLQLLCQDGQTVWLDGFERGWISRGELQQYIEKDGLTGVRSNFESLNLAIQGQEYDRDFTALAQQGMSRTARSNYDYLIVRDLQLAADLLKQVHSQTQGRGGYVQMDLPPNALLQPETAIAAAQEIWRSVGWSNLLLRIPATQIMLPVIEQLISDRINVNATVVSSPIVYEQIFDRYLKGIEKLIQRGAVGEVACFASVPMVHLDAAINGSIAHSETSFGMMQANLLYERYHKLGQSARWRSLPKGAKPLRLVWDYTEIPPASAWHYLQTLVAPGTVVMLSPSMLEMYREVSLLPTSLTGNKRAKQIPANEPQTKISLDEQVDFANEDIARSFKDFHQLLDAIEHKRKR
ncbi:transaldolase [Phormidium sp. FACHB-592]|uniref:Transaldolase n=1 Tax=Stenomitos frigidus AS-A4 TaxID=2933935 RepID=A0ABV0KP91_9CYAN|nr:transaldolase family protein [Phormidium sp. FACHB-592]MBD2075125.1 transaldolase [Phormidium sp. FACHB-592]